MWRIHENREEQGLEGTYRPDGLYTDKTNNTGFVQPFTMDVSGKEIFNGTKMEGVLNSPFNRFSHEIAENPEFHEDLDRNTLDYQLDTLERLKPFKHENTIGEWYHQPLEDRDDKFRWAGVDGDTMYNDPADSNLGPAFDHRMDEEKIWNFPKTIYNTDVIENQWISDPMQAGLKKSFIPTWSKKLLTDAFFSKDKLEKMKFVWELRRGLEKLKVRHAFVGKNADEKTVQAMKEEIKEYIDDAYQQLQTREMGDVVVTDHTPKDKKYATLNSEDDQAFFEYTKAVEEYNSDALAGKISSKKQLSPEDLVKPIPGSTKLEDGTTYYKVNDSELVDDETLFKVHQKLLDA